MHHQPQFEQQINMDFEGENRCSLDLGLNKDHQGGKEEQPAAIYRFQRGI